MIKRVDERYKELQGLMALCDERALDARCWSNSRLHPFPSIRAMVWARMKVEGYSTVLIGSAAGRNHSTVSHQITEINGVIDNRVERWVLPVWEKFNSIAGDVRYEKKPLTEKRVRETLELAHECGYLSSRTQDFIMEELGLYAI